MCLHGDSDVKKGKAKYQCRKCGALTDKKGHLCKREKIGGGDGKKKGKKKDGKKSKDAGGGAKKKKKKK